MKFLTVLTTLAATVQAAGTTANTILWTHDTKALADCEDVITIKATTTAVATSKFVKVKLPATLSLTGTIAVGTHVGQIKCNNANVGDASGSAIASLTWDSATNTLTATHTADACVAGAYELPLKKVCTYGHNTGTPSTGGMTFQLETDDSAAVTSTEATAVAGATAIASPVLVSLPRKGGEEGKFEMTFTGIAKTSDKFAINLPTGYTFSNGAICKIGPTAATVAWTALSAATTTPYVDFTFTAGVPLTAAASKIECDKVKAPATLAVSAGTTKTVSIKIGTGATAATHAAWVESGAVTGAPTAFSAAPETAASAFVVAVLGAAALIMA
jgi:hypothetical protein